MKRTFATLAGATAASASSLTNLCSTSNIKSALPTVTGLVFGDVTASAVYNASVTAGNNYPGITGRNYCNVTVNYHHSGKSDSVNVWYYFPEQSQFKGRFLATGGGGYAINSGASGLEGGLVYGAASGCTDGGMGWGSELEDYILKGNGSIDYDMLNNFGYLSIHEMTVVGQGLSKNLYNIQNSTTNSTTNSSRLYSYYQGCSEGGRDGWSQVQRYQDQFDGAAIGAPAFRQAFQQTNHDWPQIYEHSTMGGYAPNNCALTKIKNETVNACDALDGKTDGVVARSDLCRLQFNVSSVIGQSYSCGESTSTNPVTGLVTSSYPAVNGTVNEKDVAVFMAVQDGPYDKQNRHLYVGFQPGCDTSGNAAGTYDDAGGDYYPTPITGIGAEWIQYFLNEVADESLSLDGVDVETLRSWMVQGQQKYAGTMQTVWTDLSGVQKAGGKVIHYHGEADNSIPTLSSVIYWEQVRRVLYPNATFEDSIKSLGDFYRLYIVPGAAHCNPSAENGPFPQTVLGSVIDWVENGVVPTQLNATILQGDLEGTRQDICSFPYRPQWSSNSTESHSCVMPDQDALGTWFPVLDSTPINPYGDM